jgi:hypothetical protein
MENKTSRGFHSPVNKRILSKDTVLMRDLKDLLKGA